MNKAKHINRLKSLGAFWSYSPKGLKNISDNQLIEETLRWGDVPEIKQLFETFQLEKIKEVWLSNSFPMNVFFRIITIWRTFSLISKIQLSLLITIK